MTRSTDILLTALAPAIWGSTYLVTTEALPDGYPVTLAVLRALPAGLILLAVTRCLPPKVWIARTFALGTLNFAVFWSLLYVAAYRLPGGVAATLGSLQTLMVIGLARGWLGTRVRAGAVAAAATGIGGAASMAAGTVLSRKWQPPVPVLSFTAWQLTAGGLVLAPLALILEPSLPALSATNFMGLAWLTLVGAAMTYWIWFRGIARLEPDAVSMLAMMSPVTAIALGWLFLQQALTAMQMAGAVIVLASVWAGQVASRPRPVAAAQPISSRHMSSA
jgi:probable blue pigment (indigoidine) exporter